MTQGDQQQDGNPVARWWRAVAGTRGRELSAKLIVLTICFVMLAEVLIFVPSVANFRLNWLQERLVVAQIALLALDAKGGGMVTPEEEELLLSRAHILSVALRGGGVRVLALSVASIPPVTADVDLQHTPIVSAIFDAFHLLLAGKGRIIRVMGEAELLEADSAEVVLDETMLRQDMIEYGLNILNLSIIISLITATLIFISLNFIFVRPMRRFMENMVRFREDPEDKGRLIIPSGRGDELGQAERELADLQANLQSMLKQKQRLADLGLAVSKINHDLRNMLANAHLVSDSLSKIDDPAVQRLAPRLFSSLDRAIDLCTSTLKYGKAEEHPPKRSLLNLKSIVDQVGESIPDREHKRRVAWQNEVPDDLEIDVDPDHIFRILLNLGRNAVEAFGAATPGAAAPSTGDVPARITVSAKRRGGVVSIRVADNGPGLAAAALGSLFQPFSGSARAGGTGLGLAITAELVDSHGGRIQLDDTVSEGAAFDILIPDRTADLPAES